MQPHLSHPKYRPDIDGLRAFAVLPVVAFHAFPDWLRGGFTGVDVFFVISGYLISTILFENLERGTFSFATFYARRIKRIFPALLLVLLASFAFGWFTLLADEYKQLGKHMAAGAGFVSNIALWGEAGYFDNSGETKPLLHLWSLGIEEQFYFVWPVLLWFAWKRNFNLLSLALLLAVVSFALSAQGVGQDAVATFYAPHTRFWELLCGSMLAWMTLYRKGAFVSLQTRLDRGLATALYRVSPLPEGKTLAGALSLLGLALLLYGYWRIHKGMPFPGKWALVPVLGAVLVIAAGPKAWANRVVFGNRLAVWFGLISFPLYLWHWPLLSFARIVEGGLPSIGVRLGAVVAAVVLAWLTYRLVERPLRLGGHSAAKTASLLVLMALVGFLGYNTYSREGLVFRFNRLAPDFSAQIQKIANAWVMRGYPPPFGLYTDAKYGIRKVGVNPDRTVLLIGDSHGQQYWNTIGDMHRAAGDASVALPSALLLDFGFPPVLNAQQVADPAIRKVVISYYWAYRYGSDQVNQAVRCCGAGKNGAVGMNTVPILDAAQMDALDAQLRATVKAIRSAGKEVYLVLDNPFGEELDPHAMLSRSWGGFAVAQPAALTRAVALARTEPVRSRIVRIASDTGAHLIDPFDYLCDEAICPAFAADGELLYKDYDHLSYLAAVRQAAYFGALFR